MVDRNENKRNHSSKSSSNSRLDEPPNSRIFIVGSRFLTEGDYWAAFQEFGKIEELWVVKDKHSGESKGIAYIKYAKTSQAARAFETMNGKVIGNQSRAIRVVVAASREQGARREDNEQETIQRLFIQVPKSMTDAELFSHFKVFGDVDYATILRDKKTRESRGVAYVKYFKFSHAAKAYEECDRQYKPVFAEPRPRKRSPSDNRSSHEERNTGYNNETSITNSLLPSNSSPGGYTKLMAIVSPQVNQDQLWRLFDIVPGLDYCQLSLEGRPIPTRGVASIVYNSSRWAAHAKEKLHGFEYPPGCRIIVKPDLELSADCARQTNILQLAETIAQASSLIQAAGLSPDFLHSKLGLPGPSSGPPKTTDLYCSIPLPEVQPLADIDDEVVARCFIKCAPRPLSDSALKNVFSRFGQLIDVYMLKKRNIGFANYASEVAAQNAIHTLHGIEVNGVRLTVEKAEEPLTDEKRTVKSEECSSNDRKRKRFDEFGEII